MSNTEANFQPQATSSEALNADQNSSQNQEPRFEDAISELEQIVQNLNQPNIDLDEAIIKCQEVVHTTLAVSPSRGLKNRSQMLFRLGYIPTKLFLAEFVQHIYVWCSPFERPVDSVHLRF